MEHARQSRDMPGGTCLTVLCTAVTLLLQPNLRRFHARDYPDIRLDIDVNDGFVI